MTTLEPAPFPVRSNWISALADQGWVVVYDAVPSELASALKEEAVHDHKVGELTLAGVGRVDDFMVDKSIRRDKTRWLNRESAVRTAYLDVMENIRLEVNKALFLGLFSYEAHYAVYEPGGFYKRHLDAFKGMRNRVLSTVFYLNEDWQAGDGGELAIYADDAELEPVTLIPPEMGTMVIFLSEDISHEVLPARKDRYSIAGWFRVNDRAEIPVLQAPVLPVV